MFFVNFIKFKNSFINQRNFILSEEMSGYRNIEEWVSANIELKLPYFKAYQEIEDMSLDEQNTRTDKVYSSKEVMAFISNKSYFDQYEGSWLAYSPPAGYNRG